jgi:branched-chain amino acid transport system permease protein
MPAIASSFLLTQIFGWSYMLGTIALSLMFLAGYGGMVSLAQMTIAGFAGYVVAILGVNGVPGGMGWPWWLAVPAALILAMVVGAIIGALAVRTAGIYTIMITLAIAAAFFYFANQNYAIFNGHTGVNAVPTPVFLGVDWHDPLPSYYLELCVAFLCWLAVSYIARAPFGLALQGIRDNPRRMAALGFNVNAHRIAAYVVAAVIAALGGILLVWNYGEIAPGTVSVSAAIDILVIAVVGGIGNPIGPFIGALLYALLKTFALDVLVAFGLDGNRFRLLIGLGFLAIVFFSPDGIIGLWARWRNRVRPASRSQPTGGGHG